MGKEAANALDEEVRKVLAPFLQEGSLSLSVVSYVVWGTPQEI
jgi:hypothetical protein